MPQPIRPDLVRQLQGVADPSLTPDGSRLAYTRSWVEAESWESRSRIMMMRLDGGPGVEFTQGTKDSAPRFSPNGNTLAFLRADSNDKRQVWVMDATGGEARQLTDQPAGVLEFDWSPDAQKLAFCADVNPDPQTSGGPGVALPQVREVRRVRYRFDTLGWRGDSHFHIFVTDPMNAPARQITDGDWDDLSPTWSPDGQSIAFISGRRDDRDFKAQTEAYVVAAQGGEPVIWSEGLSSVGALTWSPDGQRLLAVGSEAPGFLVLWQGWLYLLEPGQTPQRLTDDSFRPYLGFPTIGRAPEIRWFADQGILLLGESQGESFIYQVSPDRGSSTRLFGSASLSTDLSLDGSGQQAVIVSSTPHSPSDLHSIDLSSNMGRRLTDYNRDYLTEHPPAQMEKFTLARDGWDIQCRLYRPWDFDSSSTYPLILDIHGGPNGAFYDSFVAWQQVLAAAGYLVLAVNPRGSSTYGNEFMMAVLDDWGGEDYLDLMAAVDAVQDRPYVDRSRLGVHGYSYGGYMSSWIVGHTNRFKAAVVGAPCINLHSMYGTSDIGISFGEVQWGISPEDATHEDHAQMAGRLLQRSPITYASQVETPVLLLHGEADARCPIGQSEEYFVALKRLGKEVKLVRFPECSHLFLRFGHPKMREEYLEQTLAWFNKYLS